MNSHIERTSCHKRQLHKAKLSNSYSISIEIKLYLLHMEYFAYNHSNCWSQISRLMQPYRPSVLKNLFYSHAVSYLKKMSMSIDYFTMDTVDAARMAFFAMTAYNNLHQPDKYYSKSNHLYKLIRTSGLTIEKVDSYITNNSISINYETIKKQLGNLLIKADTDSLIAHGLVLPIDEHKTLFPIKRLSLSALDNTESVSESALKGLITWWKI